MLLLIIFSIALIGTYGASKSKPHTHGGILEPYDGFPMLFELSNEQLKILESGNPVLDKTQTGSLGRGLVIQDIHASPEICMSKIADVESYPKVVPYVKNVQIYEKTITENGTSKVGAEFKLSSFGFSLTYFLNITINPQVRTLTWTLDYRYNSDFDDNVGHWQVMPHPTKLGWSRILYSTSLKLFPWVPDFVVKLFTGKALTDSTAWVKRESEKEAMKEMKALANVLNYQGGYQSNNGKSSLFSPTKKPLLPSKWLAFPRSSCFRKNVG